MERKIEQLMDRLVNSSGAAVIRAYENQLNKLETARIELAERSVRKPTNSTFDQTYRTACSFLANPWKLWSSGYLEDKRLVLRLVFGGQLPYDRKGGYSTADLPLPFKVLRALRSDEGGMVDLSGPTANQLLDILSDWNSAIEASRKQRPTPPGP